MAALVGDAGAGLSPISNAFDGSLRFLTRYAFNRRGGGSESKARYEVPQSDDLRRCDVSVEEVAITAFKALSTIAASLSVPSPNSALARSTIDASIATVTWFSAGGMRSR